MSKNSEKKHIHTVAATTTRRSTYQKQKHSDVSRLMGVHMFVCCFLLFFASFSFQIQMYISHKHHPLLFNPCIRLGICRKREREEKHRSGAMWKKTADKYTKANIHAYKNHGLMQMPWCDDTTIYGHTIVIKCEKQRNSGREKRIREWRTLLM